MAEENQVVDEQVKSEPSIEVSPVEQKARELGWIPKEEFNGDDTTWLDAGEFVRRQPLFEKIEQQNRELKQIKRTVEEFSKHHAKVREAEYQRALNDLKVKKVAAFEEGDAKKIVALDDEIRVVEKAKDQFVAQQTSTINEEVQGVHPELEAWINRNSWSKNDKGMAGYANALGEDLLTKGLNRSEILREVEKRVREEFPNKFKNANREKAAPVESSGSRGTKSSGGYTPTEEETRVAEKFVKQGLFKSKADYFKELELLNGKS